MSTTNALGRVPLLNWRELVALAAAPHVDPIVRRNAERYLEIRLQEMTLGERVAVARRAVRGTIGVLIGCPDAPVVNALLGNPRMVEADALRLAADPRTGPETLGLLAAHHRFRERRELRLALARNPRTPAASALGIVRRLDARDLQRLGEDDKVPRIVRIGAERRLLMPERRAK